ncbi:MAG: EscU/YscU/HrcU family type III secretion system export apparatus switch protein [Devosiaceae bacterium]|nr:EscU/YscU/HrcU family type III secretion system export apparatus switch protein [Devosiaceae bacterium MH13]
MSNSHDTQPKAPTLAIALRYAEEEGAPTVVASGRGSVAEAIVATAQEAGVAVEENPALAGALENVPLDEPIPESLYLAVAEVIGWVLRTGHAPNGQNMPLARTNARGS